MEYGFRLPSAFDNRPLKFEEFQQRVNQVVYVSATPGEYERSRSGQVAEQIIRPTGLLDPQISVRPIAGQIDDLIGEINQRTEKHQRTLVTTLTKRMDFHTVTASQVFGVPVEAVTPLLRGRAKAVNFGIVYGISPWSLGNDIGVSTAEAKAYMDAYYEKYSGVRAYMDGIIEKAKRDGYVETLYGRRRSLPELKSSNFAQRSFGERVALNMPIQGTAADIIKLAMADSGMLSAR